jgi:clan AA aspartic protease (TIGR02281 family)
MASLPLGKGEVKRRGKRVAILAFGAMVNPALEAGEVLDATVVNMRFVKPLDADLVKDISATHELIVTLEEHQVMGGAGSAVCEELSRLNAKNRVLLLGLPDRFIDHGDPAKLLASVGLDRDGIVKSIQAVEKNGKIKNEKMKGIAIAASLALWAAHCPAATSVMVLSISGERVDLLVNGSVSRSLYRGETSPEGVYVVEVRSDSALIEVEGKSFRMTPGSSTMPSVVLQADPRGHFLVEVAINGMPIQALVDTGASTIAMNLEDARRMGVDLIGAPSIVVQTAAGPRRALRAKLGSVQLGDIALQNVEAIISEGNDLPVVLLGMSFLNRLDMQRTGRTLILTRRQ